MILLVTQCAFNDSVTRIKCELGPYKYILNLTDAKWFKIFLAAAAKILLFKDYFQDVKSGQ
jgi:hypothetical protein